MYYEMPKWVIRCSLSFRAKKMLKLQLNYDVTFRVDFECELLKVIGKIYWAS